MLRLVWQQAINKTMFVSFIVLLFRALPGNVRYTTHTILLLLEPYQLWDYKCKGRPKSGRKGWGTLGFILFWKLSLPNIS